MANWTSNRLRVAGDETELRRFCSRICCTEESEPYYWLNHLAPPHSGESTVDAWGTRSGAFDVECPDIGARPLILDFESRAVPPVRLVQRISAQFPGLVFGLVFLDEMSSFSGWLVCVYGALYGFVWNDDVFRWDEASLPLAEGEFNPDSCEIHGYDAVAWHKRLTETMGAISRSLASELGFAEEVAKFDDFARAHWNLDEIGERATLLEEEIQCTDLFERVRKSITREADACLPGISDEALATGVPTAQPCTPRTAAATTHVVEP